MKKLLFFLLAILFAIQGYGQTVQTSFGTTTQSYIPIYTFYGYTYSQQIVTNAELVAGGLGTTYGQIVKIRWHWNGTGNFTNCADWKIYIGHTTKTSFASSTDWEPLTSLTLVYDSLLTAPTAAGWFEFILQTPFTYNGTDNLIIAVDENTPAYGSTAYYTSQSAASRGIYSYSDSTNPDPAAPPSGTVTSNIPNLQLYFMETCPAPINVTASTITDNSATIEWTPFGTATVFNLEYKEASASTWTTVTGINTTSYTIPSLTPNTNYQVRLQADCITETSVFTMPYNFTTSLIPVTLPYFNDFENSATYTDLGLNNGTQKNKWVISNAPGVNATTNGEYALYISNNDTTNAWAYTSGTAGNSRVYAMMDVVVPAGVNEVKLDFDWIANGNSAANEFLRVYWLPTNIPITPGQNPPTVASVNYDLTAMIGNYTNGFGQHWLSRQTTWQHAQFSINATQFPTLAGNTWRLLIHWRNDQTTAAQPPATVDNLSLVVSNCVLPTFDSIVAITTTSADIYFTENGTSNQWNIQYRILGTTQWSTQVANLSPFTLSGLQPSTSYEVRIQSDCISEQSIFSPIRKMNTLCGPLTEIPWFDNFDNYSTGSTVFPACWTRKSNVNYPYISATNLSAPGSMYFYAGSSGNYNIASTPMIDATIPINTLMVDFNFRPSGADDTLYVGVMTDPLNDTTFTTIGQFASTATAVWQNKILYMNSYQGIGQYIAFKTKYGASSSTIYVDNLKVLPMPTCLVPNTISSSNITPYTATIDWLPGDASQSMWWIYYKPTASATWDSVQVYAYPHILDNLIPSTGYQFYMRTDCSSEMSAATPIMSFTTQCIPISTLPWNDGFESITAANQLPACWAATSINSYTFTQITDYNSYNRNARTGTAAAYFRYGCNDRFYTPGFELTAGVAYKFTYWYVTDGYSGWTTLQAGVYSAQNTGALIQTINTITAAVNTTYQEAVCYFTPTTDGVYFFGIYCQSTSVPYYLTLDDFTLDLAPDCLPAQNLSVSNIVGTSAFVNWMPVGTPDYFTVAVSPSGLDTWTTYTTVNNQYILTGLTELTAYDVMVYPNCSGIDGPADTVTFSTVCAAGGDLIIGTPSATTATNGSVLPTQTYYNYSYTQQIFDEAELTGVDTIHSIAFQYFYGTSINRNLTIYMGHTMQSTFASTANFIPLDSLTIVYQGPVLLTNTGADNWLTINLTTPFDYNTYGNIVIAVRDMTGTYEYSADKFRTHATTGNKAIYFYQDASAIDPIAPSASSSSAVAFRNNIKISLPCETVTCYTPNVILSDLTSASAEFIIVPGGTETTWEAEYKETSATTWTSLGSITASPYSLPGLNSNTSYQIRFRSDCGASDYSTWRMVSFTTLCGTIDQLPFVENFDTYGTGSTIYPTCWTRNSTYGANPYITTTYPVSTPNSFYFYSSSTTYSMIVLPPVDATIPINTLQLTLWARISTLGNNLQVGVMTNPNDITTFTLVSTIAPSALNTLEELTVSFANYLGTGAYIAIKSDLIAQSLTNTVYTDNYTLDLIPSCAKPIDVVFSDVLTTSATASWTPVTQAPGYEVVYGLPGIDPNTEIPVLVTDTFYTMTSLTANTLYHFYVRSMCSATDTSDWTFLRTFRTACDAITTLPWSDYFDTYPTTGYFFPQCWTKNSTQTDRPYVNSTNFSSPGSLYFYAGSAGVYNIAATPMFDSSIPINTLKAEFKYRTTYAADTIYVGVMTNPLDATTFVQIAAIGNTSTATWFDKEVNFSSYTGTGQYIAFKNSNLTTYSYGYIDNLDVMLIPTCPRPTNPTISNATSTSIDMNWTEAGSATEWQIEYGAPGFSLGTGTQITVNTHPYTIPSLTPSSMYDFYVRAICGVGDTSIWSTKVIGGTAQIPAQVPVTFDFETPSGFQFANNASGNNWYVGAATNNTTGGANAMYISNDNGVTNAFTNTTPVIVWAYRDLQFPTSTADFTLTFDWKALAESCCDYLNVYIGDVTTPIAVATSSTISAPAGAATVVTTLNSQTAWQTVTYTLPAATYSGQVKRIYFGWRNDSSVGDNPPAAVDNIAITTSTPICAMPTNLAVNGITSSSATATWTAGGTETEWEIAYKPTASATWMTAFVATIPSYNLPSLLAATDYDVKVRAICGSGDTSAYTAIVNFTTATSPCDIPTNVLVPTATITDQSAVVTWSAAAGQTQWQVEYKLVSSSNWTTMAVSTSTTQPIQALQSNSTYEVRVKALCSATNESPFTSPVQFTTAGATTYTITATASGPGTISPSGTVLVAAGANQTFTFTPTGSASVVALMVDNQSTPNVNNEYTFSNVLANHTISVDFAEGIDENDLAKLVELYPNPTHAFIEIRLNETHLQVKECRVYDIYGKLMSIVPVHTDITKIDVTDLAAGVYFVRMNSDKGTITKKFVKK